MASKTIVSNSLKIFKQCVNAVLPTQLIRKNVTYDPALNILTVSNESFDLNKKNVHLVGTGKAVRYMALEIEHLLGTQIKSGIISVPIGSLEASHTKGNVEYFEGAENNLPDLNAEATSIKIKNLVSKLGKDDVLIVLISGGGSALLTLPTPPITLQEKATLVKSLANAGADIKELNTVRKKLSELKGGRLAAIAQPARVVTLILSDVVGDPLDLIASGPTVCDTDHPLKAKHIIQTYNLYDTLPETIQNVLLRENVTHSYPKDNVSNYIIGSNRLSLNAALQEATSLGYPAVIVSSSVVGSVTDVARDYIALAKCLCDLHYGRISNAEAEKSLGDINLTKGNAEFLSSVQKVIGESSICLLFGGETTVHVGGSGRGGRNQHMALQISKLLNERREDLAGVEVHVLCAGTDGIDGPTDAAGAVAHGSLPEMAAEQGLSVEEYLRNNDSYTFYKLFSGGALHVITGHTHTNVMDVHVMILSFVK